MLNESCKYKLPGAGQILEKVFQAASKMTRCTLQNIFIVLGVKMF
jgi:hypothetical protein